MRGGAREGAGHPKGSTSPEGIRPQRQVRVFDDEWELVKEFTRQIKKGIIAKEDARAWLAANIKN